MKGIKVSIFVYFYPILYICVRKNLQIFCSNPSEMAKISYKLDTRRALADGTYPLKISVSHRGKTYLVPTEFYLTEEAWARMQPGLQERRRMTADEKIISEIKTKMTSALHRMSLDYDIRQLDAAELRDVLVASLARKGGEDGDPFVVKKDKSLFLPYYSVQMEQKEKKGTRDVYAFTLKLIRRFEEQNGRDPDALRFDDITPAWLLAFDEWMSPTNGVNSRSKNMRNIRCVFNSAIDEGMKVDYPFSRSAAKRGGVLNDGKRKFKIKTNWHTPKRNLTMEQLRVLRDYPCAPHQEQYRDMFMLMVYLIGINPVDLFTARPYQLVDGRLEYDREKTGRAYSVKIEPEAMAIIKKYRGEKFLLNPCDRYKSYQDYLHHMNDQLKLIGVTYHTRERRSGEGLFPRLSAYWARHTWTSIAMSLDEMLKDTVGKALGHSWALDSVTDIYINMDPKKIDAANRRVLDAIRGEEGVEA